MIRLRKLGVVVLMAAVSASAFLPVIGQTTKDDAKTMAAARSADVIVGDLRTTSGEIGEILESPKALMDEATRKKLAPKLLPPLRKMVTLLDELGQAQPEVKQQIKSQRFQMLAMLALLGDKDTTAQLDATAKQTVDEKAADAKELKEEVVGAKLARHLVAWWDASNDEKAQGKVLEEMKALAKESPKSDQLAQTLMMMKNMGAATPKLGEQAEGIVTAQLTGRLASAIKTQKAADVKKAEAVGKPMELAGKTVGGKDFSTTEYKGKVILVDFWATWCGPCIAELPRVKDIYKKYHDKGLEIVGISCDGDGEKLASFVKDKDMPWVQLWDKDKQNAENQWHELATRHGVRGIPTMFLIDRNGILRSMEAREDMEEMIPKLLEEKAGATTTTAPAATKAAEKIDAQP